MSFQKEKKQSAMLIVIVTAIVIVLLYGYLPVFSFTNLKDELDTQDREIYILQKKTQDYERIKLNQDRERENSKKDLAALELIEQQLLGTDPSLWFHKMLREEKEQFRIDLTNFRRGARSTTPAGLNLPNCEIFTYAVTVEGSFNEIGRFIAYVENKYPLLAVRTPTIRGRGVENPTCDGELEFRVLAKKSERRNE